MQQPEIHEGEWIRIKSEASTSGIDGYVFAVYSSGNLSVGYLQNNHKPIKEDVIWDKEGYWKFKYTGAGGLYLKEPEASYVKAGPPKMY